MAKNDVVLIDGIIDQRLKEHPEISERGKAFDLFARELLLKDYDLNAEEIEVGETDGRDDGGIDGFYIFINGHLLDDAEDFQWPRNSAAIQVWIVSSKHHDTFQQATIDSLIPTVAELFDLSISDEKLSGPYNERILECRNLFGTAYRELSIGRPNVEFRFVYLSRGDSADVGESVRVRSQHLTSTISKLFSSSTSQFEFIGSGELVNLYRKTKKFALDLPYVDRLAPNDESNVILVRLRDYAKFVTDDSGNLRRYLFDSNVRDYLGSNPVNEDIAASLADESAPEFWWLNNGVTILATSATQPGKYVQLQDIQIVNGLQTTETIFRHFSKGTKASEEKLLLVKIFVTKDEKNRDQIIRATNNQTLVETAALHATDKVQRDIEDILERHQWYYERRKNYFKNVGKPQTRFVQPMFLASAYIALVMKNPHRATRLRSRFMRTKEGYDSVFSAKTPLEVWPKLVEIFKKTENILVLLSAGEHGEEKFVSKWRSTIALLSVGTSVGDLEFGYEQLLAFNTEEITEGSVGNFLGLIYSEGYLGKGAKNLTPRNIKAIFRGASSKFGFVGAEIVGRRDVASTTKGKVYEIDEALLVNVDKVLPRQPWKPGVHKLVAEELGILPAEASQAIQILISKGKRLTQRDGIVYDRNGDVLEVDGSRIEGQGESFQKKRFRVPKWLARVLGSKGGKSA